LSEIKQKNKGSVLMPEDKKICGRSRPNYNKVGGKPLICNEPVGYHNGEPYKVDGAQTCRGCFLIAVKDLKFESETNYPTIGPVPAAPIPA
jgi:hypothetical protein